MIRNPCKTFNQQRKDANNPITARKDCPPGCVFDKEKKLCKPGKGVFPSVLNLNGSKGSDNAKNRDSLFKDVFQQSSVPQNLRSAQSMKHWAMNRDNLAKLSAADRVLYNAALTKYPQLKNIDVLSIVAAARANLIEELVDELPEYLKLSAKFVKETSRAAASSSLSGSIANMLSSSAAAASIDKRTIKTRISDEERKQRDRERKKKERALKKGASMEAVAKEVKRQKTLEEKSDEEEEKVTLAMFDAMEEDGEFLVPTAEKSGKVTFDVRDENGVVISSVIRTLDSGNPSLVFDAEKHLDTIEELSDWIYEMRKLLTKQFKKTQNTDTYCSELLENMRWLAYRVNVLLDFDYLFFIHEIEFPDDAVHQIRISYKYLDQLRLIIARRCTLKMMTSEEMDDVYKDFTRRLLKMEDELRKMEERLPKHDIE